MNRIVMMIGRNFFRLPFMVSRLFWYADHTDRYPEEKRYAMLRDIVKYANQGGNITLEPHGKENIPAEGSFIMYPNHQGLYDMLAIVGSCERPLSVVNKIEVSNTPFLKQAFMNMKAIGIKRDDLRQSMQVILQVIKEVKEGRNFVIFPEGTRSRKGNRLLEFKAGSFKAATKAGCPIVPVALVNSYKAFDTKSSAPLTVEIYYLPPLMPEEYREMSTQEIALLVHDRIEEKIHGIGKEDE